MASFQDLDSRIVLNNYDGQFLASVGDMLDAPTRAVNRKALLAESRANVAASEAATAASHARIAESQTQQEALRLQMTPQARAIVQQKAADDHATAVAQAEESKVRTTMNRALLPGAAAAQTAETRVNDSSADVNEANARAAQARLQDEQNLAVSFNNTVNERIAGVTTAEGASNLGMMALNLKGINDMVSPLMVGPGANPEMADQRSDLLTYRKKYPDQFLKAQQFATRVSQRPLMISTVDSQTGKLIPVLGPDGKTQKQMSMASILTVGASDMDAVNTLIMQHTPAPDRAHVAESVFGLRMAPDGSRVYTPLETAGAKVVEEEAATLETTKQVLTAKLTDLGADPEWVKRNAPILAQSAATPVAIVQTLNEVSDGGLPPSGTRLLRAIEIRKTGQTVVTGPDATEREVRMQKSFRNAQLRAEGFSPVGQASDPMLDVSDARAEAQAIRAEINAGAVHLKPYFEQLTSYIQQAEAGQSPAVPFMAESQYRLQYAATLPGGAELVERVTEAQTRLNVLRAAGDLDVNNPASVREALNRISWDDVSGSYNMATLTTAAESAETLQHMFYSHGAKMTAEDEPSGATPTAGRTGDDLDSQTIRGIIPGESNPSFASRQEMTFREPQFQARFKKELDRQLNLGFSWSRSFGNTGEFPTPDKIQSNQDMWARFVNESTSVRAERDPRTGTMIAEQPSITNSRGEILDLKGRGFVSQEDRALAMEMWEKGEAFLAGGAKGTGDPMASWRYQREGEWKAVQAANKVSATLIALNAAPQGPEHKADRDALFHAALPTMTAWGVGLGRVAKVNPVDLANNLRARELQFAEKAHATAMRDFETLVPRRTQSGQYLTTFAGLPPVLQNEYRTQTGAERQVEQLNEAARQTKALHAEERFIAGQRVQAAKQLGAIAAREANAKAALVKLVAEEKVDKAQDEQRQAIGELAIARATTDMYKRTLTTTRGLAADDRRVLQDRISASERNQSDLLKIQTASGKLKAEELEAEISTMSQRLGLIDAEADARVQEAEARAAEAGARDQGANSVLEIENATLRGQGGSGMQRGPAVSGEDFGFVKPQSRAVRPVRNRNVPIPSYATMLRIESMLNA